MSNQSSTGRVVGQTAAAGFQIGVRRTFPISAERAWKMLTSPEGLKLWLGEVPPPEWKVGETFASRSGLTGEFRVVKPKEQLRLRWQRPDWAQPSTLQIRFIPAGSDRTTISFHQEKLDHAGTRDEMKRVWEDVLETVRQMAEEA